MIENSDMEYSTLPQTSVHLDKAEVCGRRNKTPIEQCCPFLPVGELVIQYFIFIFPSHSLTCFYFTCIFFRVQSRSRHTGTHGDLHFFQRLCIPEDHIPLTPRAISPTSTSNRNHNLSLLIALNGDLKRQKTPFDSPPKYGQLRGYQSECWMDKEYNT